MLITLEFDEKETCLLEHLLSIPVVPFRGQGLGDLDGWVGPSLGGAPVGNLGR